MTDNMQKWRNSFVVWSLCYLWFISLYSIVWSLFLFLTIRATLWVTGTDLINLFVLLSGLFLLPANVQILSRIASGKTLNSKTSILCCPLWEYLSFVVVINLAGAVLCARKIRRCHSQMQHLLIIGMRLYKTTPVYKNFMDNVQWTLKCCGIQSYKDWFTTDWFDQIRDYDWDVKAMRNKKDESINDSVPLSCCKTGSCFPHYLTELGARSINQNGCAKVVYRILIVIMSLHLILFCSIALVEMVVIYCSFDDPCDKKMQLLSVNCKYRDSSTNSRSRQLTDCATSTVTDCSNLSETDASILDNSLSEMKKSLNCVKKLCSKEKRISQTGSPQPRFESPSRNKFETPNPCCTSSVTRLTSIAPCQRPSPPPKYPQTDKDQSVAIADGDSEKLPGRPSHPWRLCKPDESPSQPICQSPCCSQSNSASWSVPSRQLIPKKSPEVITPPPSILSVELTRKKSAGTQGRE